MVIGKIRKTLSKRTVSVRVEYYTINKKYNKRYKRRRAILIHFKNTFLREGMNILCYCTRPISKKKSWEMLYVI
ncbi:30S ribosomal protein S17 [Candidatus Vidania fulgoroideorum]